MIHSLVHTFCLDYAKKAENAVDYEDIQEEYEGPEVHVPVQDQQFYAQAALAVPFRKAGSFVPEEDNYDEDDENDVEGKDEPKIIRSENATSPLTAGIFLFSKRFRYCGWS